MKKTNLPEAKINFSKLVKLAAGGEEIIICKAGVPVAKLVAINTTKTPRKPGFWSGKVTVKEDFDTPLNIS
jgi:prevent-host-death family protein